jgi:hypothetical protein
VSVVDTPPGRRRSRFELSVRRSSRLRSSSAAHNAIASNIRTASGGEDSHVVANSVIWFENAGNTIIQADVNGDTTPDIRITLSGIGLQLNEFDFFL